MKIIEKNIDQCDAAKIRGMKVIENFNKLHGSYNSKMEAVIAFLEQDDTPPVPAEVLVEIAKILQSAHAANLESIILIAVELEAQKEALHTIQTKLQSLN